MTMDEINSLYNFDTAQKIFKENHGWFEIDGINAPKYEAEGKRTVLQEKFGPAKIGDLRPDTHVLAVTYAVEDRKPVVIKSTKPDYLDLLSCDAADASSAAPTYFPTRELEIPPEGKEDFWLVDGESLPIIPPCAPWPKPGATGIRSLWTRSGSCRWARAF